MAGGTINSTDVYSIPTGVVAVAVFDGVDGIAAAFVDVAVVTIDTAVVAVFGAGLDNTIIWKTTAVGTVATEAESCVGEGEDGFGECRIMNPAAIVAAVFCAAGVGTGVVGAVVGDVTGVAWVGHGSYENSTGILVAVTAIGACATA